MNYCLLSDAWGKNNHITNQYKEYNNSITQKNENVIEHFEEEKPERKERKVSYNYSVNSCDSFFDHLDNCKSCSNRLKAKYKSKVISNIQDIINDNRDAIVLVLIGISILLFFNLIYNLTKN